MLIKYIGKCADGRRIPVGGNMIEAKKGQPVEVPDNIANDLLKIPSDWVSADAGKDE
jgi:hypothetical protein